MGLVAIFYVQSEAAAISINTMSASLLLTVHFITTLLAVNTHKPVQAQSLRPEAAAASMQRSTRHGANHVSLPASWASMLAK